MKTLTLQRVYNGTDCTLGLLLDDSQNPFLVTLELPWQQNKPGSCINSGLYECLPHDGLEFQDVPELQDVAGHTGILMHNGNFVYDTKGCILIGQFYRDINGQKMITNSKASLEKLKQWIGRDPNGKLNPFNLVIVQI